MGFSSCLVCHAMAREVEGVVSPKMQKAKSWGEG